MFSKQYKAFSANVTFATRTLHTYLQIKKRATRSKKALAALNSNARFWVDYDFIAPQTVIIFLGKIFENDVSTHNVGNFLSMLDKSLAYFSREAIRSRKPPFEGIEDYLSKVYELSSTDVISIRRQVRKARKLWEKIKPLRDNIYAHDNAFLTADEVSQLYASAKFQDLRIITQTLVNIRNVLWEAEYNGKKPDFRRSFRGTKKEGIDAANKMLASLISSEKMRKDAEKRPAIHKLRRKRT